MTRLVRQLKSWRSREWLFSACVAAATVLLFAVFGVTIACAIDYICDSQSETPFWLRVLLTVGQVVVYLGFAFLAFRMIRTPSIDVLAGRAEAEFPEFDHRVVTALQLNRSGARTDGMSKQLIEAVTVQAGELAGKKNLAGLTNPNRLFWAALLLVPVAIIPGAAFLFNAPVATALLKRQLLLDVEIPRSVQIENATKPLHPAGDAIQLKLKITGPVRETSKGTISVKPASDAVEHYDLVFSQRLDDGTAIFIADMPPASEAFTFTARILDGRMRTPVEIRFEPRPVVTEVNAWVLSPPYVDPEPDPAKKRRYEKLANQGEVVCHPDCDVRVVGVFSKSVKEAWVILSGKKDEKRIAMKLEGPERKEASAEFPVQPGFNAYRIEALDDNDFPNLKAPRRGIALIPDRPPTVILNDELLMPGDAIGATDDYQVRGMPLLRDGQVQIGYTAKSPLGLSKAFIIYRVNDGPWTPFDLTRVEADETKVGKFRPELGVFTSYDVDRNVEFYPLPSPDPESEPAGLTAGGRYNFKTSALRKVGFRGKLSELEVGDRVEFRVAVYDRKTAFTDAELKAEPRKQKDMVVADPETATQPVEKRAGLGRAAGYSDSRLKAVVTDVAFRQWQDQQTRSRERLRDIEKLQRGVFGQRETPEK